MAGGYTWSLLMDTKNFSAGVSDATGSLDKLQSALHEIEDNGGLEGNPLASQLQEIITQADVAQASLRNLGTAQETLMDDLRASSAGKLAPTVGADSDSASTGAQADVIAANEKVADSEEEVGEKSSVAGEIGKSAMQNLGYSALSAGTLMEGPGGPVEAIGQFLAFGGSALDMIPGIGTALAALAVGGGFALSLLGSTMTSASTSAADVEQAVKDFTNSLLGAATGGDTLDDGLRKWAKDSSDYGGSLTELKNLTDQAKVSYGEFTQAIATQNVPQLKQLKQATDDQILSLTKQAAGIYNATGAQTGAHNEDEARVTALNSLKKVLDSNIEANQQSAQALEAVAKANGMTVEQYKSYEAAQTAAKAATTSFASSLHSSLQSAAEDTSDFTTNGVVNLQKYVANLNSTTQAIAQEAANLSSVAPSLTQAGLNFVEGLGEQAAPLLAAAVQLGPSSPEYQQLMSSWNSAGLAATTSYGKGVKAGPQPVVTPTANTQQAETNLGKLQQKRTAEIEAQDTNTSAVSKKLDAAAKKRTATIQAQVDTSGAERQLNALTQPRSITITVNQRKGKSVPG